MCVETREEEGERGERGERRAGSWGPRWAGWWLHIGQSDSATQTQHSLSQSEIRAKYANYFRIDDLEFYNCPLIATKRSPRNHHSSWLLSLSPFFLLSFSPSSSSSFCLETVTRMIKFLSNPKMRRCHLLSSVRKIRFFLDHPHLPWSDVLCLCTVYYVRTENINFLYRSAFHLVRSIL